MASVKPYKDGYRAQVAVLGVRDSKTFRTKREADAWGYAREAEIHKDKNTAPGVKFTLGQAMSKYGEEVSPHKRGERWEQIRLKALQEQPYFPSKLPIGSVTTDDMGKWRDARLRYVSAGTVLREIALLSSVFETARLEWKWITANPMHDMRKPSKPEHRDVLINWRQIRAMLKVMRWRPGPCKSAIQAVGRAFMFALRTGMRESEICGLKADRVKDDYCILPVTKTKRRNVPISRQAKRILDSMDGWDDETVFGISPQTLDSTFRKQRIKAGLSGFTFHDSRHTAATMLSRKIDVLDLCKMFGWTDPKQAMIYYNPTASDIAKRLSGPKRGQSR